MGPCEIERVTFASRSGARLVGLWHPGRAQSGVVFCHGMESCKEGTKSVLIAERLSALGAHVLRFDFSFVGESEGRFGDLTVTGEVDDLAGAWRFARQRLGGPIGIIGSSLGGTVALLFAAEEPAVAAVATIAAVATPGRWARDLPPEERERWRREGVYELHGSPLGFAFLEDVERLDVSGALGNVRCPLLVTHGTADAVVPFADAETITRSAGGPARLLAYPDADHRFSDAALLGRLVNDLVAWMSGEIGLASGERPLARAGSAGR